MTVINPFSTRFVRPGAAEFLMPEGWTADRLVDRLEEHDWWGEIVGPHGSGKSTLLHYLAPVAKRRGRELCLISLSRTDRRWPKTEFGWDAWDTTTQIIVDGYEQLNWWHRRRLLRRCRRAGAGLLTTVHRPMGLPRLWKTEPSLETAGRLVEHLLRGFRGQLLRDADIADAYHQHNGNVREMLFSLYDLYEQRATAIQVRSFAALEPS